MKTFFRSRFTGIGVAVIGLILMIFGIFHGEAAVVFSKAVRICMECIGIG